MTEDEARKELEEIEKIFIDKDKLTKPEGISWIDLHMQRIRSQSKGYWVQPTAKIYVANLRSQAESSEGILDK